MSTKQKTQNTNTYDQQMMDQYQTFQAPLTGAYLSNISNPLAGTGYQQQLAQGQRGAAEGAGVPQLTDQMTLSGVSSSSPLFAKRLRQQAGVANTQRAGLQNMLLNQGQSYATQNAMAGMFYSPMQTGSTQTTEMGGPGSYV
jgi:hypothetical protein